MNFRQLKIALVLATLPGLANAGVTVSAMGTHQYYDNIFYDKTLPQFALGYRFDEGSLDDVAVELVYGQTSTDINRSANNRFANEALLGAGGNRQEVDLQQFRADAKYFLNDGRVEPYVAAGAGQIRVKGCEDGSLEKANNCKENVFQYNVGGGLQVGITEHFKGFVDGRYLGWKLDGKDKADGSATTNNVDDVQISAGLSYDFGHKAKPMPVAVPKVTAPAPQPVAPRPKDTDRDGIIDNRDACPYSRRGARVDARGCEIVIKKPQMRTVEQTLNIKFDSNKAFIKPQFMNEVSKVARVMKQDPRSRVEVAGFTDSRGSDKLNQRLSQRRANAVKAALVNRFGINASRIRAVGYGEQNPIASNKTAAGRAANRRVTARVSGQIAQ